jgi:nicotinamidase-related amidase
MKIHLVVIDPQNDFCSPQGSLYVGGAEKDMDRLAVMIRRLAPKLADIHITLDSHRIVDISHPLWWRDASGKAPSPFTVITAADVEAGRWDTRQVSAHGRSLAYLKALEKGGRYPHVIWPEHCLIGGEGHNVFPSVLDAAREWERKRYAMADFVTKGSNPWTEHFSAVQAEVPDPSDPSTQINTGLIQTLEQADVILLAGEALSHCVHHTVKDTIDNFSDPSFAKKVVLLQDCMSSVTGFEKAGEDFLRDMRARGVAVADSVSVFV